MNKELGLNDIVYYNIKEKIIKCELKPGESLNELGLSEKLKMSRTPIRESILKLNVEDFVTIYPRKRIIVSEITLKNIRSIPNKRSYRAYYYS